MIHVEEYDFSIDEFMLRFKEGIDTRPYYIINYKPYSKKPIHEYPPVISADIYQNIVILYKNDDKIERLAKRLEGDLKNGYRGSSRIFPGFNKVFDLNVNILSYPFNEYDPNDIYNTFKGQCAGSVDTCFPLIILPKVNKSIYDSIYYRTKAEFLRNGIVSQVVTIDLLENENNYKWALLPIAIQMFAKMGGVPYILNRDIVSGELKDYLVFIMGLGISQHPLYKNRGVGFITVFDNRGAWYFMNAKTVLMRKEERDLHVKLSELLRSTINEIYKLYGNKNIILIIHYSGKDISSREENAIRDAINKVNESGGFVAVYVLKIIKDGNIAIWEMRNGEYTYPPVGTVFRLKQDLHLLVTSGCFDEDKTDCNIRRGLSRPIIISRHRNIEPEGASEEFNITDRDLLATVFGMCMLNYNTVQNPVLREPITTRYSREIAWLTLRLKEDFNVDIGSDVVQNKLRYIMWFI